MAVHNWIDAIVLQFAEITNGKVHIHAYQVYEKADLPEKLEPDHYPCAITSIDLTIGDYSSGGSWEYTLGRTEFHLYPTKDRALYGECLEWIPLIRNKVVERISVGGLLDSFQPVSGEGEGAGIRGPVELVYAAEAPHWGLVLSWIAKENVSTEVTVGA